MPMIDLVFKNYTHQKAPAEEFFKKILEESCKVLRLNKKLELSVNLVGEAKIKNLNKKYRRKNKPTDVLSFPLQHKSKFQVSGFKFQDLGDIFICLSIAKKEAKRENVSIRKKLAHLTVHGFLHLLGYNHEKSEASAEEMFQLENKVISKMKL